MIGIYELDVEGHFLAKDTSTYDLTSQFYGINRMDDKLIDQSNNKIEVVNLFNKPASFNLTGKLSGYEISHTVTIQGSEKFRMPFVLRKGEQSKEFQLELSKEDYNKLTDLAIIIYDSEGVDVSNTALGSRTGSLSIDNSSDSDSSEFVFEIVPGFSHETSSADIQIKQITNFKSQYSFDVISERKSSVTLYPSLPKQMEIYFEMPNEYFPIYSQLIGEINFESVSTKKSEYLLPIKFKF